jgi:hypothetical protein
VLSGEATRISGTMVTSVFFRAEFELEEPSLVEWLVLRADYSHGFVAYLNGSEIARRGVTGILPPFDAIAAVHPRGVTEEIDVSDGISALLTGTNVLAIQLHGAEVPSTNLVIVPELCANFQRGPYVQNAGPDSAEILWRTPVAGSSIVDYGLTATLGFSVTNPLPNLSHRMRLLGLAPDTAYFYRVRSRVADRQGASPIYSFRTMKLSGDLSFAVLGDSGSGWLPQLRVAAAMSDTTPDLVLHVGDTAYGSLNPNTADIRCLSVYAPQMRTTPLFPSFGNHDLYSGHLTFLETFSLPTNSMTGTSHFYSFDHGDAHFVSLFVPTLTAFAGMAPYALAPGSAQLQWLTNDLSATTQPWRVLYLHSPLFTSSGHREDDYNRNGIADRLELQQWLLPVAAEHGVQLVFSGHDHCYERFASTNGVHCYVTGGGGYSLYGMVEQDALSRHFEARHHFLHVNIAGDSAIVQGLDQFGTLLETSTVPRISPPRVRITALESGRVRLGWNSDPGRDYAVETAGQPGGLFTQLNHTGLPVTATEHLTLFDLDTAVLSPSGAATFLRVVQLP